MSTHGTGLALIRARSLSSIGVPLNHLLGLLRRSWWPLTHFGLMQGLSRLFCMAMTSCTLVVPYSRWMAWSKASIWGRGSLEGMVGRREVMGLYGRWELQVWEMKCKGRSCPS